jgi:hypothetical protein
MEPLDYVSFFSLFWNASHCCPLPARPLRHVRQSTAIVTL